MAADDARAGHRQARKATSPCDRAGTLALRQPFRRRQRRGNYQHAGRPRAFRNVDRNAGGAVLVDHAHHVIARRNAVEGPCTPTIGQLRLKRNPDGLAPQSLDQFHSEIGERAGGGVDCVTGDPTGALGKQRGHAAQGRDQRCRNHGAELPHLNPPNP